MKQYMLQFVMPPCVTKTVGNKVIDRQQVFDRFQTATYGFEDTKHIRFEQEVSGKAASKLF